MATKLIDTQYFIITLHIWWRRLIIFQMFLFLKTLLYLCLPSFPLIYIKEIERWRWLSHGSLLALTNFGWTLFLERSCLLLVTSRLVNQNWTQSNIYGEAKVVNYFHEKAPLSMFDWALNTLLAGNGKKSQLLNKK